VEVLEFLEELAQVGVLDNHAIVTSLETLVVIPLQRFSYSSTAFETGGGFFAADATVGFMSL
jgi:hypothetical protein